VLAVPVRAGAEVSLAIGGALAVGQHDSLDGTVHGDAGPVPLIDIDADRGAFALHLESIPFVQTPRYGDQLAPSVSFIESAQASLRGFLPGRTFAFGLGYGFLLTTVDRTAPEASLRFKAGGLRLEAFQRFVLSPTSRIELTFGAIPRATGSLVTDVGIDNAPVLSDPLTGMQLDATVRGVIRNRGPVSLSYGIRYLYQRYAFATSHVLVERNDAILPFAEVRFRL